MNSSSRNDAFATSLAYGLLTRLGYSYLTVRMQLGSQPMIEYPFSTNEWSRLTLNSAFSRAAFGRPFEIIGRPQHFRCARRTSYPAASSSWTAAFPMSG